MTGRDRGWSSLRRRAPDAVQAWESVVATSWEVVDPVLLELCRLRMAQLLGSVADQRHRHPLAVAAGLTDEQVTSLPHWPRSPAFTAGQRSAIGFAEQFVIDVSSLEQRDVDELAVHMTAREIYAFVSALWALEALQRACLVLGAEPELSTIGVRPSAGGPA